MNKQKNTSFLQTKKGFTLIELLMVFAILTVIASIILVAIGETRAKSRDAKRKLEMSSLQKGLELYYHDDHGHYPIVPNEGTYIKLEEENEVDGFNAVMTNYMASNLEDPLYTTNPDYSYQYTSTGSGVGYKVCVILETQPSDPYCINPPSGSGIADISGLGGGGLTSFQKTIGGTSNDYGRSVTQTSDGGYVVAGYTDGFALGEGGVFLLKFDPSDSLTWAKTIIGTSWGDSYTRSVTQTSDGGYIITGDISSVGAGGVDIFLTILDKDGALVWTRTIGGTGNDYGRSATQISDGSYIITGYTTGFGVDKDSVFFVKLDPLGNLSWAKTITGSYYYQNFSATQISDGSYIITGYTTGFGVGWEIFLLKLDPSGNLSWAKTIGGSGEERSFSVVPTSDNNYIITGYTNSYGANSDFFLLKLDPLGNILWAKTIGGSGSDVGYSTTQTSDSGYIITGGTYGSGVDYRAVFLVKLDLSGNFSWAKTIDGINNDDSYSVVQTSDDSYIVSGLTYSFGATIRDAFLLKLDPSGNIAGCSSVTSVNSSDVQVSNQFPTDTPQFPIVTVQNATEVTLQDLNVSSQLPITGIQCSN